MAKKNNQIDKAKVLMKKYKEEEEELEMLYKMYPRLK